MGFPVWAIPLIIAGASTLMSKFGGGGDSNLERLAGVQASSLTQAQSLLSQLSQGGAPPVFKLNLDNPQNIEKFFSQVAPMAEFNSLLALGGQARGAAGQEARLDFAGGARQEDQLAALARNLVLAFLSERPSTAESTFPSTAPVAPTDPAFDPFTGTV